MIWFSATYWTIDDIEWILVSFEIVEGCIYKSCPEFRHIWKSFRVFMMIYLLQSDVRLENIWRWSTAISPKLWWDARLMQDTDVCA